MVMKYSIIDIIHILWEKAADQLKIILYRQATFHQIHSTAEYLQSKTYYPVIA